MQEQDIDQHIVTIFEAESRIVIAALITSLCDVELAEDGLQDALLEALQQWRQNGIPINAGAWIMTTARRKVIDRLRRGNTQTRYLPDLYIMSEVERNVEDEAEIEVIPDERLRLMFTCCHPALSHETQVALTLQTIAGLPTEVIAHIFLLPVPTMAQRLVRAKRKIRDAKIPYIIPSPEVIDERLTAVLSVIYFIFNAGYIAPIGEKLLSIDLCAEAIRLARTLRQLLVKQTQIGDHAETLGLLSLMLLHHARRDARIGADGQIVLFEAQEREKWDQDAIYEGVTLLDYALTLRKRGPFQIQAAIAALHVESNDPKATDWRQIVLLYQALMDFIPSSVVALNYAVAVSMLEGVDVGLALLDQIGSQGRLDNYYLFHSTYADFLRRLGRKTEAQASYQRALALCNNQVEYAFIEMRLKALQEEQDD